MHVNFKFLNSTDEHEFDNIIKDADYALSKHLDQGVSHLYRFNTRGGFITIVKTNQWWPCIEVLSKVL